MPHIDISEDFPQNYDIFSCVNGVTGITGPWFITQDRISDISEFFGHAVEEAATEPNRKYSVADMYHLQYYTDASKN